jgi:uncharacterized repeat protein (TIGR01451 family)
VTISDTLPADFLLQSSSTSQFACNLTPGTSVLYCTMPTLDGQSSATVSISGIVLPNATGLVVNTATVTSTEVQAVTTRSATVTVPIRVDLSISEAAISDPATAGAQLKYQFTVTNAVGAAARNVVITDTLDPAVSYVSSGPGLTCTANNRTVACTVGQVASGATSVFTLTGLVAANTLNPSVTNLVTVTTSDVDLFPLNNSASLNTSVQTQAHLRITKSSAASVNAGAALAYTVNVFNDGPSDAQTVEIDDNLTSALTYASTGPLPYGLSQSNVGPLYKWATSTLPANKSGSFVFTSTVINFNPPQLVSNTVSVSSATVDPNINGDNSFVVTTTVMPVGPQSVLFVPPTNCAIGVPCVLTATVSNASATLPMTFTWTADEQASTIVVANSLTGTVVFTWTSGGIKHVSVSASNAAPGNPGIFNQPVVIPLADLAVSILPQPAINAGDVIQFTLVFTNYGPTDATNVVISATLGGPYAGYAIGGVVSTAAGFQALTTNLTRTIIFTTTDPGLIIRNTPYQLVFTATTPTLNPPSTLQVTAAITSSAPDYTPTNNTYLSSVGVNLVPLTGLSFSGTSPSCKKGQLCSFTVQAAPVNVTLPVTYTWTSANTNSGPTGSGPGGNTSTSSIDWSASGSQTITSTAVDYLSNSFTISETVVVAP